MKGIAIILAGCMLFLNIEHLLEDFQFSAEASVMECCPDNCSACCDTEQDCADECDCSYQFQITAIAYSFIEVPGVLVQSYHYGNYMNSYTFEYSVCFLQPPRFG